MIQQRSQGNEQMNTTYVNLPNDVLNFVDDFFFLSNELIVIPLKNKPFYAIVRVKDGTCLCQINLEDNKFIFNTEIDYH